MPYFSSLNLLVTRAEEYVVEYTSSGATLQLSGKGGYQVLLKTTKPIIDIVLKEALYVQLKSYLRAQTTAIRKLYVQLLGGKADLETGKE
jgi:hypothetical protein